MVADAVEHINVAGKPRAWAMTASAGAAVPVHRRRGGAEQVSLDDAKAQDLMTVGLDTGTAGRAGVFSCSFGRMNVKNRWPAPVRMRGRNAQWPNESGNRPPKLRHAEVLAEQRCPARSACAGPPRWRVVSAAPTSRR